MGFLRRISTILGFVKDETHSAADDVDGRAGESAPCRPARGFSVQVPIASEKPSAGPIVVPCSLGEGGVQGFGWYSRQLRIDEDGDVADEFLDEVLSPMGTGEQNRSTQPRFEVKYTTKPAPVRKQAITNNGIVYPCMEYKGMLRWV